MFSVSGFNPYIHVPDEIRQDMFYPLIFWKSTPECYGPAWVLLGTLHTVVAGDNMVLASFLHKFILLVFLLGSGWVFYKIAAELGLGDRDLITLSFVANPLLVLMTIVDGHNEIVMVFFMLLSMLCLIKDKRILALVLLAVAVNVKFVYLILLPFFVLYMLFGGKGKSVVTRVWDIVIGAVLSLIVSFVLWLPFGWQGFKAVIGYYTKLSALLWPDSIPYAVYFLMEKAGLNVTLQSIADIFVVIFAVLYLALVWWFMLDIKKDRQIIFTVSGLVLLFLLLTNATPFQPWYLLWGIPFILLSRIRSRFMLVFMLSYFLLLTFWKRMSVLDIPLMFLYFSLLFLNRVTGDRMKFLFPLEPLEGAERVE